MDFASWLGAVAEKVGPELVDAAVRSATKGAEGDKVSADAVITALSAEKADAGFTASDLMDLFDVDRDGSLSVSELMSLRTLTGAPARLRDLASEAITGKPASVTGRSIDPAVIDTLRAVGALLRLGPKDTVRLVQLLGLLPAAGLEAYIEYV